MESVYLLGAGASHGYSGSRSGVRPPLAGNFFSTFYRLLISQDQEVKIGFIVNYLRDTRGIPLDQLPTKFDENIEIVFAELHAEMHKHMGRGEPAIEFFHLSKAYDQFVFWFAHVINEIQCGAISAGYRKLVNAAEPGSTFITFNWDTLLDRALAETGKWYPDDGYGVDFEQIMDGVWRSRTATTSAYTYLKLHGSTNWLGPYGTLHLQTSKRTFLSSEDRVGLKWCIVDGSEWYRTYKDRWRPGYTSYSYFLPPNDPEIDTPLMPIIVPPTGHKDFNEFGDVFHPLWAQAHARLAAAHRLVVIGYSFPRTDTHAFQLLDSFCQGRPDKRIEIIDPFPEELEARVAEYVARRCAVSSTKATMDEYLGLPTNTNEKSEYDQLDQLIETAPSVTRREAYILDMLSAFNLDEVYFDLTTHSGQRLLDCIVPGEFATHMLSAYRPEVFKYRIGNIVVQPSGAAVVAVALSDIWIVQPVPAGSQTEERLAQINLAKAKEADPHTGVSFMQMIEESYHCRNSEEVEHFVRRVLAAQSE